MTGNPSFDEHARLREGAGAGGTGAGEAGAGETPPANAHGGFRNPPGASGCAPGGAGNAPGSASGAHAGGAGCAPSGPRVTPLARLRAPLGGQEIELQQIEHEAGGMSLLRTRIRERSRFTVFDVDPVTAAQWGEALLRWARAQEGGE